VVSGILTASFTNGANDSSSTTGSGRCEVFVARNFNSAKKIPVAPARTLDLRFHRLSFVVNMVAGIPGWTHSFVSRDRHDASTKVVNIQIDGLFLEASGHRPCDAPALPESGSQECFAIIDLHTRTVYGNCRSRTVTTTCRWQLDADTPIDLYRLSGLDMHGSIALSDLKNGCGAATLPIAGGGVGGTSIYYDSKRHHLLLIGNRPPVNLSLLRAEGIISSNQWTPR